MRDLQMYLHARALVDCALSRELLTQYHALDLAIVLGNQLVEYFPTIRRLNTETAQDRDSIQAHDHV
jgi:hypothetical protein